MKKIFLLGFAILLMYSEGFSQNDYAADWVYSFQSEVGKRPAAIFHDIDGEGYITKWFVYCAGYDENHNGILDEGDEAPSLWAFSLAEMMYTTLNSNGLMEYTDPVKIMDFDFEDVALPVRIAWIPDSQGDIYKFYLPESNKLIEVTVDFIQSNIYDEIEVSATKEVILDEPINYVSVGKNMMNQNLLFLSKRNAIDNTGEVLIYNLMTNKIDQTLSAGAGVQMTFQKWKGGNLLILNEKMSEDSKGSLMNYKYVLNAEAEFVYELKSELELPNSPSHIDASDNNKIVVTASDSDTLQVVSLISSELQFSEKLIIKNDSQLRQTTISDGDYYSYEYYTTSYKGYMYFYNQPQVTGEFELTYRLRAYGQAECMKRNYLNTVIIIATPYDESGEISNNITVYGTTPTSVNDDNTNNNIIVYPNPAGDFINISIDSEVDLLTREVQIIDLLGLVVSKSELQDGNNRIDISNLQRGTYFIKIGDRVEKFVKK